MTPRRMPFPDAADAPKYWMYEVGGELSRAVLAYLDHPETLTAREVILMRAYLSQWIQSPAWDLCPSPDDSEARQTLTDLRTAVGAIACAADVTAWLRAALAEGIDPL